jgi:hypothetical protein
VAKEASGFLQSFVVNQSVRTYSQHREKFSNMILGFIPLCLG